VVVYISSSGTDVKQKGTFRIFICLLMLWTSGPISAQQVSGDQRLQCLYDSLFQTSLHVVNGKSQQARYPEGNGHPYFGGFAWTEGMIGKDKADIPYPAIRYDLLDDALLIQHFSLTGSHVIIVNKQIARTFTTGDHKFYLLDNQSGTNFNFEPGYHELVYSEGTELWIRWKKFFSERSAGSGEYRQTRTVFIRKEDHFYEITNRRSLLRALQDREDEIKSFIRQQGIPVSRAGIGQLISIISFYDEKF
jgi:hypothetical protein